jgi:hypothetical protein
MLWGTWVWGERDFSQSRKWLSKAAKELIGSDEQKEQLVPLKYSNFSEEKETQHLKIREAHLKEPCGFYRGLILWYQMTRWFPSILGEGWEMERPERYGEYLDWHSVSQQKVRSNLRSKTRLTEKNAYLFLHRQIWDLTGMPGTQIKEKQPSNGPDRILGHAPREVNFFSCATVDYIFPGNSQTLGHLNLTATVNRKFSFSLLCTWGKQHSGVKQFAQRY